MAVRRPGVPALHVTAVCAGV